MKYHIIVCAILKDETPYLVEWVEHHLGIGVEHFVLYDNNSVIPAKQTLEAYVRKGVVEVIDCPITNTPQVKAYSHCLFSMHDRADWIAYIDIDEFIVLKKHRDIHAFLVDYDEYAGVCLNWVIYTANGHIEKPEGPVMQNYTEPLPYDFPANRHVKSIVQPAGVGIVVSPHYALYSDDYYRGRRKAPARSRSLQRILERDRPDKPLSDQKLRRVARQGEARNRGLQFQPPESRRLLAFQSSDAAFKAASRAAVSR